MLLLDFCEWDFPTRSANCPKLDPNLPHKDVRVKQKRKYRIDSRKLEIACYSGDLIIRRAKRGRKIRASLDGIANMNEHSTINITWEERWYSPVPKLFFKCSGCFGEIKITSVVELPAHISEVVVDASSMGTVFIEDGDYALMEVRAGTIVSSAFADKLRMESIFKGSIFADIDMLRDCSLELHSGEGSLLVHPRNVSEISNMFYSEYPIDDSCVRTEGGYKLSIMGSSFHSKLAIR